MDSRVLGFAACCRANGMRISTSEVLDCLAQLSVVQPLDAATFHIVLKANFAKSPRETREFDRLFDLFFIQMKKGIHPETAVTDQESDLPMAEEADRETARQISRLEELWAHRDKEGAPDKIQAAVLSFLSGNPQALIELIRKIHDQETRASQAVKSNLGQLTARLEIMLTLNRLRQKIPGFLGDIYGKDTPKFDALHTLARQRLDQAQAFLNTEPGLNNAGLRTSGAIDTLYPKVGQIPFANLRAEEMARVQTEIDAWVKKLEEVSTLRFQAARKGRVDVKKTIHRSGRYLGVPIEIVRKDKPLRKAKIVTLCDVSGSVWSSARFMLGILYSLQSCFAKVRTHVFIDRPLEVTHLFETRAVNPAIENILNHGQINYNARTDYGLTFQQFYRDHGRSLDKKTTLIVMGDGRSNYLNPREPVLEKMRERCCRLIWLNPEPQRFWGTGDSEMLRYQNHCNEARACGNLNQLIAFFQVLVL